VVANTHFRNQKFLGAIIYHDMFTTCTMEAQFTSTQKNVYCGHLHFSLTVNHNLLCETMKRIIVLMFFFKNLFSFKRYLLFRILYSRLLKVYYLKSVLILLRHLTISFSLCTFHTYSENCNIVPQLGTFQREVNIWGLNFHKECARIRCGDGVYCKPDT